MLINVSIQSDPKQYYQLIKYRKVFPNCFYPTPSFYAGTSCCSSGAKDSKQWHGMSPNLTFLAFFLRWQPLPLLQKLSTEAVIEEMLASNIHDPTNPPAHNSD